MATFQTEKLRVFFAHLASSQYTVKELLSCFASLSVSSRRNLEVVKALKYEDKEDSLYAVCVFNTSYPYSYTMR